MPEDEQVEQALQDILPPELQALKVEIKRLDEKIVTRLDSIRAEIETRLEGIRHEIEARFESVRGEISGIRNEINSLRSEMGSLRNEFLAEIKRLDESIGSLRREVELVLEIRERLAALEAKVGITRP